MRKKVHDVLNVVGRKLTDPGAHMYHAADGVAGGGEFGKEKRHKIRKALARLRLRASGMTDDILGSKETQGVMDNPYEATPSRS
jgi:hypothetical protein